MRSHRRRSSASRLALLALVAPAVLLPATAATAAAAPGAGAVSVVSVDGGGVPMHNSYFPDVSGDGRLITFTQVSSFGLDQVYVRDQQLAVTTLVSHAQGSPQQAANGPSSGSRISRDGRWVSFVSAAGDIDGLTGEGLFVHDVATGVNTRVSSYPDGSAVTGYVNRGGISSDGRFLTFATWDGSRTGAYLVDRDTDRDGVYDELGATSSTRVDDGSSGSVGAGQPTDDGRYVVFTAEYSHPTEGYNVRQVMRRDMVTGATTMLSSAADGTPGNGASNNLDVTPDGRFVVFDSYAWNLHTPDSNGSFSDIYLWDAAHGGLQLLARGEGTWDSGGGNSGSPAISDDGRFIAFTSDAANLVASDTNIPDMFLLDRASGTTSVLTRKATGEATTGYSPVSGVTGMSKDGRVIVYDSGELQLVAGLDTTTCEQPGEVDKWTGTSGGTDYSQCVNVYASDIGSAANAVPASGGSVTSGTTATAAEPLVATVTTPALDAAGSVTITSGQGGVPGGYDLLGQQLQIEAPVATWDNPLRIQFVLDATARDGVDPFGVQLFRDGVAVADCISDSWGPATTANADGSPCIAERRLDDAGDLHLVVLTPHASTWAVAVAQPVVTQHTGTDGLEEIEASFATRTANHDKQRIDFDGDGFDHLEPHTWIPIAPEHYASHGITLEGLDARDVDTSSFASSPPVAAWQAGFDGGTPSPYSFTFARPVASFGMYGNDVEGDVAVVATMADGSQERFTIKRQQIAGSTFYGFTAADNVIQRLDFSAGLDFHIVDDLEFGRIFHDADLDGVHDEVDPAGGTPGAFENAIAGRPTTSGTITSVASGLTVRVIDAVDPEGVRVLVEGTGTGTVTLTACEGYKLELTAGSDTTVTCGSVRARVAAGTAKILLSDSTVLTIGAGATVKVDSAGGDVYTITEVSGGHVILTNDGVSAPITSATTVTAWRFEGFSAPIRNGGTLNDVQAGRAVPLRWRLLDSSGEPITDLSRATLSVASATCRGGRATADVAPQTVGGGASGLQNLGDGHYQVNWKSPTSYTGSCKTLKLDLGEGITRDVQLRFTR